MLGLQALQGLEQLPGLAGIVADALALLDDGELALLSPATVLDGLLGLFKQASGCRSCHDFRTHTAGGWFGPESSLAHVLCRRTGIRFAGSKGPFAR
jgi:hypothetical protein